MLLKWRFRIENQLEKERERDRTQRRQVRREETESYLHPDQLLFHHLHHWHVIVRINPADSSPTNPCTSVDPDSESSTREEDWVSGKENRSEDDHRIQNIITG